MTNRSSTCHKRRRRGFVLIVMAVTAVAVIAALGLAVDLGHMFIARSETQAFVDAAALAAALQLDGTSTGIANASAAVANQTNQWNFGTQPVTNPTLTFSTTKVGPWQTIPSGAGILYTRVTATAAVPLFFLPMIVKQVTQNVVSTAVAGQVPVTDFPQGLAPYTAVSTDNTAPNFGLAAGQQYDMQWPQFNGTRNGCGPNNPDKCFVSPACSGDTKPSKTAVTSYWSSSNNGYWGSTSNSDIRNEIMDVIQLQPVSVGTNLQPILTNGNKASEAVYLDARVNQDNSISTNALSDYLADPNHNSRRLLPVPIVNPTSVANTTVIGYGQFLLITNGGSSSNYYVKGNNGNDPFCAIYAGPYNVAGLVGAGGSTGATVVKLVQ